MLNISEANGNKLIARPQRGQMSIEILEVDNSSTPAGVEYS